MKRLSAVFHALTQRLMPSSPASDFKDSEDRRPEISAAPWRSGDGDPAHRSYHYEAEAALRRAEAPFRQMIENASDYLYIWTADPIRPLLYFNHDDFLGYERDILETRDYLIGITYPDDRQTLLNYWNSVMQLGTGQAAPCVEYRLWHRQGHWEWVERQDVVLSSLEAGQPDEVMTRIQVITERKQQEERLLWAEAVYQQMREAVILYDMQDGRFVVRTMNEAAQQLYGWTQDEVRRQPCVDVLRPFVSLELPGQQHTELIRTGYWTGELVHHRRDGSPVQVLVSATLLRDAAGEPGGAITLALEASRYAQADSVSFTTVEQALGVLSQARHPSAAAVIDRTWNLLQTTIASVPIALWALDRYGTITLAEGQGLDAMGLDANDLIGKSIFHVYPPEPRLLTEIQRALNGEALTTFSSINGVNFQTHFRPVLDSIGQVEGLVMVSIDINERAQDERQQLELALERERIDMLQRFMGDVSHDFKTPLTSLKLSLHLLGKIKDEARRQRHLQVIELQTNRLEKLVTDLFTMSRLDQTITGEFNFALLDVNVLLLETITAHEPLVQDKQHTLEFAPGDNMPAMFGDSFQLDRVFTNLLLNAVNYTQEGGLIQVRTRHTISDLIVEFQDNGIGISPEDHERIFDRFYRGDPARNTDKGGMGVGLAIARKIVEAHGGYIQLESAPGAGSTFRVILPVMKIIGSDEDEQEGSPS